MAQQFRAKKSSRLNPKKEQKPEIPIDNSWKQGIITVVVHSEQKIGEHRTLKDLKVYFKPNGQIATKHLVEQLKNERVIKEMCSISFYDQSKKLFIFAFNVGVNSQEDLQTYSLSNRFLKNEVVIEQLFSQKQKQGVRKKQQQMRQLRSKGLNMTRVSKRKTAKDRSKRKFARWWKKWLSGVSSTQGSTMKTETIFKNLQRAQLSKQELQKKHLMITCYRQGTEKSMGLILMRNLTARQGSSEHSCEMKRKKGTLDGNDSIYDYLDRIFILPSSYAIIIIRKTLMDSAINEILTNISKIYDDYEAKISKDTQKRNRESGGSVDDEKEKRLLEKITQLERKMEVLAGEMDKSASLKTPQLRDCPRLVKQCLQDIQGISKRKSLLFKPNKCLDELLQKTNEQLDLIKKDLANAGQTKFLCCGTDGVGKFKSTIDRFKLSQSQWYLLSRLQPKNSVFLPPRYSATDYAFLKQVLKRHWPQNTVRVQYKEKIVEKQVPVTKQVVKYISTGKKSRLQLANSYIYGINRQRNPKYGLKLYQDEAENNNDAFACAYLGRVYEQGILVPKDYKKSVIYYKRGMKNQDLFAYYGHAMALIRGDLHPDGSNRQDIEKGFKYLTQLVQKVNQFNTDKSTNLNVLGQNNPGYPEALVELGEIYEKGTFKCDEKSLFEIAPDLKKAIEYYEKAAGMNIPRAFNNLGVLYINYDTQKFLPEPSTSKVNQDNQYFQKGYKYLKQAADLGYPQAFYNLGHLSESGLLKGQKNLQQSLINYYKGASKGDNKSKIRFAFQLINQTSVYKQQFEEHYKLAMIWLQQMVRNSKTDDEQYQDPKQLQSTKISQKAQALYYLGLMHEFGFGVQRNPKISFNYFCQSSQLGYTQAKNKVGDCYFSGFGVKQNVKIAIGCYEEAAQLQNPDALVNIGTIYLNGIPGMIQPNYNKAYKYYIKAMNMQNTNAMIHLSYMYKNGIGLEQNLQMARKLLEQAATSRNSTALFMLKQLVGSQFDQTLLLNQMDQQIFNIPPKIQIHEIVPYLE